MNTMLTLNNLTRRNLDIVRQRSFCAPTYRQYKAISMLMPSQSQCEYIFTLG